MTRKGEWRKELSQCIPEEARAVLMTEPLQKGKGREAGAVLGVGRGTEKRDRGVACGCVWVLWCLRRGAMECMG